MLYKNILKLTDDKIIGVADIKYRIFSICERTIIIIEQIID